MRTRGLSATMYFALLFMVTFSNHMLRLTGTVKAECVTDLAGVDLVLFLYDTLNRRRSQT